MTDLLINLTDGILSQCIHLSNYHVVHFKCITTFGQLYLNKTGGKKRKCYAKVWFLWHLACLVFSLFCGLVSDSKFGEILCRIVLKFLSSFLSSSGLPIKLLSHVLWLCHSPWIFCSAFCCRRSLHYEVLRILLIYPIFQRFFPQPCPVSEWAHERQSSFLLQCPFFISGISFCSFSGFPSLCWHCPFVLAYPLLQPLEPLAYQSWSFSILSVIPTFLACLLLRLALSLPIVFFFPFWYVL